MRKKQRKLQIFRYNSKKNDFLIKNKGYFS